MTAVCRVAGSHKNVTTSSELLNRNRKMSLYRGGTVSSKICQCVIFMFVCIDKRLGQFHIWFGWKNPSKEKCKKKYLYYLNCPSIRAIWFWSKWESPFFSLSIEITLSPTILRTTIFLTEFFLMAIHTVFMRTVQTVIHYELDTLDKKINRQLICNCMKCSI